MYPGRDDKLLDVLWGILRRSILAATIKAPEALPRKFKKEKISVSPWQKPFVLFARGKDLNGDAKKRRPPGVTGGPMYSYPRKNRGATRRN